MYVVYSDRFSNPNSKPPLALDFVHMPAHDARVAQEDDLGLRQKILVHMVYINCLIVMRHMSYCFISHRHHDS